MPFKSIRFADLAPELGRGNVSADPKIQIRDNAQVVFNKKAITEGIKDYKHVMLLVDGEPGVFPQKWAMIPCPSNVAEKQIKDGNFAASLKFGKDDKGTGCYFSASRLLRTYGFNYAESGNQTFAVSHEKVGKVDAMVITIPEAKMVAPPVKHRVKKEKPAPQAPGVEAGSTQAPTPGVPLPQATNGVAADTSFDLS